MDNLTDDTLGYLIEIILDSSYLILSTFLICHKIKTFSDITINNRLKRNYKILIKDNYLINPLQSYYHVNKILGNSFTLNKNKIKKLLPLICLIIFDNNIELLNIIDENIPDSIKEVRRIMHVLYDNDDGYLLNLYNKLFNKYNKIHNDDDFIRFKELMDKFYLSK